MNYQVLVQWNPLEPSIMPQVFILDPKLRPGASGAFADIPHLIYDAQYPDESALCLFDPGGQEWDSTKLIADTTLPWASEWLHHYKCWHIDGVWRGANAPGPISVGEIMAKQKEVREAALRELTETQIDEAIQ